jgi:hypothetical protein
LKIKIKMRLIWGGRTIPMAFGMVRSPPKEQNGRGGWKTRNYLQEPLECLNHPRLVWAYPNSRVFFFFLFFILWPCMGGRTPPHAKREWFQSTPIYSLGIAEPPHRPWGWFCQLSIFLFLKCFFFFSFFIIIFNYAYRHV